ncbi:hypothetical protein K9L97_04275 [Candidatus Woesearchaeota archaeon]|nr:hypothetical protein [Candidatus Woesearchaeota archaeon]
MGTLLIIIIILGAISLVVYFDYKTTKEAMTNQKLLMIEQEGKIISATMIAKGEMPTIISQGIFDTVTTEQIETYSAQYQTNQLNFENGFTMITNINTIIENQTLNILGINYEEENIKTTLESEETSDEIKSTLTGALYVNSLKQTNFKTLLDNIKQNKIQIYPKPKTLQIITFTPKTILAKLKLN